MSKKDFKNMDNPALSFITQAAPHTQSTQDTQSAPITQDTQVTQKKASAPKARAQKLPRINMAFSEENLEFLQIISRIEGVSITAYVNNLVKTDVKKKQDVLNLAKKVLK